MSFYIEFGKLLKYHPERLETDVVIPDEVEIIGSEAFEQSHNLNSVVIPEGVVEIGNRAFWACSNLLYIDIPEGVKKIGLQAFDFCGMLERVTLPFTLIFLGDYAFQDCFRLKEIVIPDKVTRIPHLGFSGCKSLAHVTLPKNLTEIGVAAFDYCESLKTIEIPEGVTSIGEEAFSESGLSRAIIPRSIKTIGSGAFSNADNLVTNIPISDWQDEWGISKERYALNFMNSYTPDDPFLESLKEENNQGIKECIYDIELEFSPKDDIKVLWYLIKEELLEVEDIEYFSEKLIDDVEMTAILLDYKNTHFSAEYMEKWERDKLDKALGIKEYTYHDWSRVFKLVKTNGGYAVEKYRGNDETVVVPGKIEGLPVTAILRSAFENADKIRSVYIEEGITQIGALAFSGCSLTEITLPETLRSIGDDAFIECMSLTEITIPSNVTDIGEDAFRSCRSLARVTLPDKITAIKGYSFCDSGIREIVIPEGVESIEEYAFAACKDLSDIKFPKSLKKIGDRAFEKCLSLKKITLHDNLDDISLTAFWDIPERELVIAASFDAPAIAFAAVMGYEIELLEPPEPKEGE